mmetsp:Transcript_49783/g.117715  ORF Transcript_49783/g.117715 Transcript_49783/m.117715 type:complete len:213 (-) Transcript_49783:965-1603(-)
MEMEAQSESLRKRICLSGGIPGRSSFGGTKNAGVITAVPAPAAGFGGAGTCLALGGAGGAAAGREDVVCPELAARPNIDSIAPIRELKSGFSSSHSCCSLSKIEIPVPFIARALASLSSLAIALGSRLNACTAACMRRRASGSKRRLNSERAGRGGRACQTDSLLARLCSSVDTIATLGRGSRQTLGWFASSICLSSSRMSSSDRFWWHRHA